ncbi:hypothetical protein HGP14_09665 [Rhizobium sp. P32RR-XVIII]|uniref:hypothetical protein n=1 Tax=Rhizobium sp. P32RR-XVIII TaxID=2726738 RepID=UPI001456BA26|nr:hypothetical protein [Rhizobium sp. P32RR-XVIII]NLS03625.1 hypothetical protein [Rhizobium sp. P32RR-XVIII]
MFPLFGDIRLFDQSGPVEPLVHHTLRDGFLPVLAMIQFIAWGVELDSDGDGLTQPFA